MSDYSDSQPATEEGDFRDAFVESIMTSTATIGWVDEDTGNEGVKHLLEARFFRADGKVAHVLMPPECILSLMEAFPAVLTRYFDGNLSTRIDIPDTPAAIDWNRGEEFDD